MDTIDVKLDEHGRGGVYAMEGDDQLGEMEISVAGNELTVYHTEVFPKAEGKGLGKKLLAAMADHARKNGLKVIPLCPFVHAQFKRRPEEFDDIWKK
ncbi:MAG TPA: GNAT family N-acetyltransferase [Chitinophagaceae bacterium]|nr:GNAT family N-acetyltransferase [Chitinophagaceae bacterium]